ncbi:two-component system chemotaxis response regulator CheY [Xanthomonas arboricola]|uniref:response regulator n=1 Tax=Xanthomonas euroxanthea TaxID=2259622 RepID=UPI00141B8364|nr:response regulator [Xanthomonas euroxanthea]NIK10603.1 two-component system chemotaxis response regulator CheY [Xanthomonas euroxanthea]
MPTKKKLLILIVDDDPVLLELAALLVMDMGYSAVTACDPSQALERLHSEPGIKLIFSDIQMPGELDGYGLVAYLRACGVLTPAILTSGAVCPQKLPDRTQFLRKPYSREVLLNGIQHAMQAPFH